jgi:hypothetical protein
MTVYRVAFHRPPVEDIEAWRYDLVEGWFVFIDESRRPVFRVNSSQVVSVRIVDDRDPVEKALSTLADHALAQGDQEMLDVVEGLRAPAWAGRVVQPAAAPEVHDDGGA